MQDKIGVQAKDLIERYICCNAVYNTKQDTVIKLGE